MQVTDDELKKYYELNQKIKAFEEERDGMREKFKKIGSKTTEHWNLAVSERSKSFADLKKLIAKFGKSKLRGILCTSEYLEVKVTPLAEKS